MCLFQKQRCFYCNCASLKNLQSSFLDKTKSVSKHKSVQAETTKRTETHLAKLMFEYTSSTGIYIRLGFKKEYTWRLSLQCLFFTSSEVKERNKNDNFKDFSCHFLAASSFIWYTQVKRVSLSKTISGNSLTRLVFDSFLSWLCIASSLVTRKVFGSETGFWKAMSLGHQLLLFFGRPFLFCYLMISSLEFSLTSLSSVTQTSECSMLSLLFFDKDLSRETFDLYYNIDPLIKRTWVSGLPLHFQSLTTAVHHLPQKVSFFPNIWVTYSPYLQWKPLTSQVISCYHQITVWLRSNSQSRQHIS